MLSSPDVFPLTVWGEPQGSRELARCCQWRGTKMARRRNTVFLYQLLVETWLYLPCFCTYTGTNATHWTLYSGLELSWNEASMFCNSLGGHLPALNTKLKWNGFNATAAKWKRDNQLQHDVWTGLFWQSPSGDPRYWEADCSVQTIQINFWTDGEPNSLDTDKCVRYDLGHQGLRSKNCDDLFSIVCEFDNGSCYHSTSLALTPITSSNVVVSASSMDSCWEQCKTFSPTSTGEECVGARFVSEWCTEYLGETLISPQSIVARSTATTLLKECFHDEVSNCYSSYTYNNNNTTPQPAGDPCGTSDISFVPVVPTSTCVQTSTVASVHTTTSEDTTSQTTSEQSSSEPKTEATWPTTNVSTRLDTETNVTLTASSSVSLDGSTLTIQRTTESTTDESVTTPLTQETTGENTGSLWAEGSVTNSDLTSYGTSAASDITTNGSSSEGASTTESPKPLLCTCMKTHTANTTLPVMHRKSTSKYRRSRNSEWGSPSVYTSTSSATFVIVVGVAGFMFVVCDINRLIGHCDKKRRGIIKKMCPLQM